MSSWLLPLEKHSYGSTRFDFFLRIVPNGDILLVEAYRNDRVNDILDRIAIKRNISVFEQRLLYGGRQLQNDQRLGDCSIEQNALVYLVGPQYSKVWPAVDSLVATVCCLYRGEIGYQSHANINEKLNLFFDIIPWYNNKAVVEYLQIFSASSVPAALAMLYSSSIEGNLQFAQDSIRKFLRKCRDLPNTAHCYIFPITLELCRLLKKIRPHKKLYWSCWNVFASMLEWFDDFYCEGTKLFIRRAVIPFTMEIAVQLHTSIAADLSHIGVFKELVSAMGRSLEDSSLFCSQYLSALESISALSSGLYKCAKEELTVVLKSRKSSLCTLIVRFAKRDDDHQWLNEFKELTNFEARRHLAMLMLPGVDHSHRKNIIIPRSNLLVESSRQIRDASPESLQHGISIQFELEEAIGDGVTREWFQFASAEIFSCDDKSCSPFCVPYPDHARRFSPNPEFMEYDMFEFAGRLMGLALMHNTQLNVFFDRIFFLQLAGVQIGLEDIKDTSSILYKCLKEMLEGQIIDYDLNFDIDVKRGKNICTEELCQDGKSTAVTKENVSQYTDLYVKHRFVKLISEQAALFAKGFSDMLLGSIPHTSFFQSLYLEDFDLMFGGEVIGIRMEDWKEHTNYGGGGYEAPSTKIDWFWNIVEGMTEKRQRNLLKFWTSTASLPHGGIRALPNKLKIIKISPRSYPTSATCFYILRLPAYHTFEEMKIGLEFVSEDEHCTGFGVV